MLASPFLAVVIIFAELMDCELDFLPLYSSRQATPCLDVYIVRSFKFNECGFSSALWVYLAVASKTLAHPVNSGSLSLPSVNMQTSVPNRSLHVD